MEYWVSIPPHSHSLKNIMIHEINKSWIEKTLIESLKSLIDMADVKH